jgi:uncharacterized protein
MKLTSMEAEPSRLDNLDSYRLSFKRDSQHFFRGTIVKQETYFVAPDVAVPRSSALPPRPFTPARRIAVLDILRGIGLLGILLLNIYEFASPAPMPDVPIGLPKAALTGWHAALDYVIFWCSWLFAEGKMRSLFSILFGAGVVLLTERFEGDDRSKRATAIFYKRNLWLLVIGICHGFLIWGGDILVDYAVLAMAVLYFLRHLKARPLLVIGLFLWIVVGTWGTLRAFGVPQAIRAGEALRVAKAAGPSASPEQRGMIANAAKDEQTAAARIQEDIQVHHESYWTGWSVRAGEEIGLLLLKANGLFPGYLGAMIFGMGLYKTGFLTNRRPVRDYVSCSLVGYAIALPVIAVGLWRFQQSGFTAAAQARWLLEPYCLEVAAGTIGNLSVLLLLLRSKFWQRALSPIGNVGRTAISNYVLTSLVCKWVFSWGPWKLYGRLEYFQWYCVVAAVWTINLVFSSLWLHFFAFGPLEWLWRSLTYGEPQPLLAKANEES